MSSDDLRLRPVLPSDVAVLTRWNGEPHVIAASGDDGAFDWAAEVPRVVPWRDILLAEVGGRPVGVMVIIDPGREETHYWGEIEDNLRAIDIWIGDVGDLGRGYGTRMMRLAIRHCFADPAVRAILVDPLARNERACRFYRRLGFRPVERRTFGTDDCLVHRLERPMPSDVLQSRGRR